LLHLRSFCFFPQVKSVGKFHQSLKSFTYLLWSCFFSPFGGSRCGCNSVSILGVNVNGPTHICTYHVLGIHLFAIPFWKSLGGNINRIFHILFYPWLLEILPLALILVAPIYLWLGLWLFLAVRFPFQPVMGASTGCTSVRTAPANHFIGDASVGTVGFSMFWGGMSGWSGSWFLWWFWLCWQFGSDYVGNSIKEVLPTFQLGNADAVDHMPVISMSDHFLFSFLGLPK
jgi:hypothetical protein